MKYRLKHLFVLTSITAIMLGIAIWIVDRDSAWKRDLNISGPVDDWLPDDYFQASDSPNYDWMESYGERIAEQTVAPKTKTVD